jgi:CDP-diacylglycerol---serine O-phosphatidyltransferase
MFLGYLNIPNLMTLTGLTAALLACLLSRKGELGPALVCLMAAGIFDLFDGVVARKMKQSKDRAMFGAQIDTISDMACFGMIPAIIAMNAGLSTTLDFILQAFYACCAAVRLGYFNVHGMLSEKKNKYFTGLPVTYAALIFPIVFIPMEYIDTAPAFNIIRIGFVGIGAFFILKIRAAKPRGIFYVIFPLLAVMLSCYWLIIAK